MKPCTGLWVSTVNVCAVGNQQVLFSLRAECWNLLIMVMTRWKRNKHPWPATSHQFTMADFSYKAGTMCLDKTQLQGIKNLSTQKRSQNLPCRWLNMAQISISNSSKKSHSCWYTWNLYAFIYLYNCLSGSRICPAHSVKLMQPCMTWDDFNPMQEQRLQIWGLLKIIPRINFPSLLQSPNPGWPRGGLLIRQPNTRWLNPQLSISVTLQEGEKLKPPIEEASHMELLPTTHNLSCKVWESCSFIYNNVHSVPEQRKQGPWP